MTTLALYHGNIMGVVIGSRGDIYGCVLYTLINIYLSKLEQEIAHDTARGNV